jgi:formylglycine-generating enzyme required for sulfatase activity
MKKLAVALGFLGLSVLLASCTTTGSAARNTAKIGSVLRDCANCPEMVVVPAGRFVMGSSEAEPIRDKDEGPQREVTFAKAFAVSRFEVTRGQFRQFINESGYKPARNCTVFTSAKTERVESKGWDDTNFPQTDAHPVSCVSWVDAKAYIDWIAAKTRQPYRLLSEAEWEYAAMAGAAGQYAFGDNPDDLCSYGNIADDAAREAGGLATWTYAKCRDGFGISTSPVGTFKPNAFGLYDMHGNLWEWVEDCRNDSYQNAPVDGSAWVTGDCTLHVDRGGAFYSNQRSNRARERAFFPQALNSVNVGFRLARNL